ncbi:MAG: pirin family protein [Chthoniobacterales bacterium]
MKTTTNHTLKKLKGIQRNPEKQWVGDGFHVHSIFSYNDRGRELSPFLLLDYAAPSEFTPTEKRRGVGAHPHKGFETVTVVYDGEVEHRDSTGGGGVISKGDVQWMTAGKGIVHEEFHSENFARTGGPFEMVQLWVNLRAKDKSAHPRYQTLKNDSIPVIELPENAGHLRVIAGSHGDVKGPAETFTPINLYDVKLNANKKLSLELPAGHTAAFLVLKGEVKIADKSLVTADIAILSSEETGLELEAVSEASLLFLGGEPIDEPIYGYGPFVMNDRSEIEQAFEDYQCGRMGELLPREG